MSQQSAEEYYRSELDGEAYLTGLRLPARRLMAVSVFLVAIAMAWLVQMNLLVTLSILLVLVYLAKPPLVWIYLFAIVVSRMISVVGFVRTASWTSDVMLVILMMVFTSLAFRYCEMVRLARAYDVDSRPPDVGGEKNLRRWITVLTNPRWYTGMLATAVAAALLIRFPETQTMIREYGLRPAAGRMVFFTLGLFFAWFICRSAISLIARFRFSPDIADISMRSTYGNEFWHELAGVEKRRAKAKFKQIKREAE